MSASDLPKVPLIAEEASGELLRLPGQEHQGVKFTSVLRRTERVL